MILKTRTKMLIARILQQILLHIKKDKNPIVKVMRKNIYYKLDLLEGIDLAILLGVYEKTTVRAYNKIIKAGDVVFDIGANIGAHTLQFADLVGNSGIVVAFEPTDYAFMKLKDNVVLNPRLSSQIILNQMMLVDSDVKKESMPELYSSWPLIPSNNVHPEHLGRKMKTSNARSTTLDTYMRKKKTTKVNLIKIDVDGYEYHVLKGAMSTIKKYKPLIIMELCPYVLNETGHDVDEIIEIFKELEYKISDMSSGKVFPDDPGFIKSLIPKGASQNIIAQKK